MLLNRNSGAVAQFQTLTEAAVLAMVLWIAAAHNRFGSISGRAAPPGQPWVKAFNIFNALGSVAFAYNFTGVLMEIQVCHKPAGWL
jgi:hypothetical protein